MAKKPDTEEMVVEEVKDDEPKEAVKKTKLNPNDFPDYGDYVKALREE